MRIGIGGGNRLLRGGVSAGRGGVRGGVGVGPFHVSGGGGSRGSVSSDMEELLVLAAPYIGKFMLFGAIGLAVFLAITGPLIYILFTAALISVAIFLYNAYSLLGTISNPYRDRGWMLENIGISLGGHVISILVMLGLVWANSRAEETALEKTRRPESFIDEPGYWGWWKRQGQTLLDWLFTIDRYVVLPAVVILGVLIYRRRRYSSEIDLLPGKLASLDNRRQLINSLEELDTLQLKTTKLTKLERQKLLSFSIDLLAELESFWRDQLDLRQHEDVVEERARKYLGLFDGEERKFLEREFSDALILAAMENSQQFSQLNRLSKARKNYLASLMTKSDTADLARAIFSDLTVNSIGGMRR